MEMNLRARGLVNGPVTQLTILIGRARPFCSHFLTYTKTNVVISIKNVSIYVRKKCNLFTSLQRVFIIYLLWEINWLVRKDPPPLPKNKLFKKKMYNPKWLCFRHKLVLSIQFVILVEIAFLLIRSKIISSVL